MPVTEVRSSDGVSVNVDLLLTLGIADPVKFAYSITTGDPDQFIHATSQDAVRLLVRGIEALSRSTSAPTEAGLLRAVDRRQARRLRGRRPQRRLHARHAAGGDHRVARGAAPGHVQLAEEKENFALEERRLNDRANLIALDQESRRKALELEAAGGGAPAREARGAADAPTRRRPATTSRLQRLKVAQQLAGNSRAVVSLGGNDLVSGLLTVAAGGRPRRGGRGGRATRARAADAAAPTTRRGPRRRRRWRAAAAARGTIRRRTSG